MQALHFYFESNEKRCFLEELPSDTIVEGGYRERGASPGHMDGEGRRVNGGEWKQGD